MSSFNDFELAPELNKALSALNFTEPKEIQAKTIDIATSGTDLMACAETGSGKTAAYAIPMISRLIQDPEMKGVILAPTRELATQIADFVRELIRFTNDLRVVTLVGGQDMRKQINAIKRKPRIIVATPGRLTDHLRRRSLSLKTAKILVLDEGDRMLDMGFAPQLDDILEFLPSERQTSLFTATLPEKVKSLARKYLNKPQKIEVGRRSLPVETIKQSVAEVSEQDKTDRLINELNERSGSIIVFAKTQRRSERLACNLQDIGFKVELIHGGRTQGQRNRAIKNFKSERCRILCATDIAARGLDVPQVEHVINYDLPMLDEDYVHRIGRTARNGAEGAALSFVAPQERRTWEILVRKYKIKGADLPRSGKGKGFGRRERFEEDSYEDRPRRGRKPGGRKSFGRDDRPRRGGKFGERRSFGRDDRNEDRPQRSGGKYGRKTFSNDRSRDERSENRYEDRPRRGKSFGDRKRSGQPKRFERDDWNRDERSEGRYEDRPKRSGGKKFGNKKKPFLAKGAKRRFEEREERSDRPPRKGKKKPFAGGKPKGGKFGAKRGAKRKARAKSARW